MKRTIIDPSQLELNEKVVSIKRVTKVVKGGRNMRFTALVVVGDGNGHVGAGLGKAAEIPEAIRKGKEDAMKKLIEVKLDENNSITHDTTGKHTGASVLLKKSPEGTGIIAGGPARNVCELAQNHGVIHNLIRFFHIHRGYQQTVTPTISDINIFCRHCRIIYQWDPSPCILIRDCFFFCLFRQAYPFVRKKINHVPCFS